MQTELQKLNIESVEIGRYGVALQRRLLSLNLIIEKVTQKNLEQLSSVVKETKTKKFEEEAL